VKCDRCGREITLEQAHVVYHLKIVCDECYREMLSRVVSIEEWFFGHGSDGFLVSATPRPRGDSSGGRT